MRFRGTVVHRLWLRRRNRRPHSLRIGDVDGLPQHTRPAGRRFDAGTMPCDDVRAIASEEIEQVAPGKPAGASDESGAQRVIPLIAPLNGEKLPRPASVNERKNLWSADTFRPEVIPPKLKA